MLSTNIGVVTDLGAGKFRWDYTAGSVSQIRYVYVTAEDTLGKKDQTVFRLQEGGSDEGSDNGDPHIHTVDGKRYDFQAAGEFTLLKDREGMEVQLSAKPPF